jgi:carbon storage regulator
MLVLSRRIGESIKLSGGIVIQIQRMRGNQVQIGIEAPTEVIVLREEVRESSLLDRGDTRAATVG